jgi:hypothetical protein
MTDLIFIKKNFLSASDCWLYKNYFNNSQDNNMLLNLKDVILVDVNNKFTCELEKAIICYLNSIKQEFFIGRKFSSNRILISNGNIKIVDIEKELSSELHKQPLLIFILLLDDTISEINFFNSYKIIFEEGKLIVFPAEHFFFYSINNNNKSKYITGIIYTEL